jgi:hypothetical protein
VTTGQRPDSLTALRALLARSSHLGSLTEVADTLVPERRHVLLRRAAIPVVFDEAMVRDVLLPNLPEIPDSTDHEPESDIGWLLGHSDIEQVGGAVPLFRMRADMRAARLEKWFAPNEKAPAYTDVVDGGVAESGDRVAPVDAGRCAARRLGGRAVVSPRLRGSRSRREATR